MAVLVSGFGKRMAASFHRDSGRQVGLPCGGWQGVVFCFLECLLATVIPPSRRGLDPAERPVHLSAMTTTISVKAKGQLALPKEFCARKHLKAGTAVRVTEVGEGLYLTPIPEPTEEELQQVIAAAGTLLRPQTAAEEEMVEREIAACRAERRRKRQ
jgi:bifunctional DNA-binding transcriptional regulator/antitoxin component of YhaV-PrlF toxin-antitoxin module